MRASLILVALVALAGAGPLRAEGEAPEVARRLSVLVIDLKAEHLDPADVAPLDEALTVLLSRHPELEVTSGQDVRRLLEVEADRQKSGCEDDSCLAEIAGALGARLVVFGQIGRVGSRLILSLNLYDSERARPVGRALVEGDSVDALYAKLPGAVSELVAPVVSGLKGERRAPAGAWWLGAGGALLLAAGATTSAVGAVPLAQLALVDQPALETAAGRYRQTPDFAHMQEVAAVRADVDARVREWNDLGVFVSIAGGAIAAGGGAAIAAALAWGTLGAEEVGESIP